MEHLPFESKSPFQSHDQPQFEVSPPFVSPHYSQLGPPTQFLDQQGPQTIANEAFVNRNPFANSTHPAEMFSPISGQENGQRESFCLLGHPAPPLKAEALSPFGAPNV
jgi:hypothetical protein